MGGVLESGVPAGVIVGDVVTVVGGDSDGFRAEAAAAGGAVDVSASVVGSRGSAGGRVVEEAAHPLPPRGRTGRRRRQTGMAARNSFHFHPK